MKIIDADILVVGSGLSGLRAACAALEKNPELKVVIASMSSGPSGSSFTNRNDGLGIQVPLNDKERTEYVDEAVRLAVNSEIDVKLMQVMAEEAVDAYSFLRKLGVSFREDRDGPKRFKGCFSSAERAYVFQDLGDFYNRFSGLFLSLGGKFMPGVQATSFIVENSIVRGVAFVSDFGDKVAVRAGKVIAALGGPAGLWKHNIGGTIQSGFSYGMLDKAGVGIKNAAFMQFMWCEKDTGRFVPPAEIFRSDTLLVCKAEAYYFSEFAQIFPEWKKVFSQRNTHCPASWWLDDRVLDQTLASCTDSEGHVLLRPAGKDWMNIIPTAHSGNGGALIDRFGRTEVQGLYCCGECATGMHGANRLGGGMVLSGLVFGKRAGEHAAETIDSDFLREDLEDLCTPDLFRLADKDTDISDRIQKQGTLILGAAGHQLKKDLGSLRLSGRAGNLARTAYVILRDLADQEALSMKLKQSKRSSAT